jgi:enterochelin esterase-like enzyme
VYDEGLTGRLVFERFESEALRGNPLGDSNVRATIVYTPPGYESGDDRYPVIFCLAGFTGTSWHSTNYNTFGPNLPQRFDGLIKNGKCGPAILVMVDGMTALGGNQYINSEAVGRYEDHIIDELVPFIDDKYRTQGQGHRGVKGMPTSGRPWPATAATCTSTTATGPTSRTRSTS